MLLLIFVSPALRAADLSDFLLEPVSIRDGFLLNQGFLQPTLESAIPQSSAWALEVSMTSSNTFAKSTLLSESLREIDEEERSLQRAADSEEPVFVVDGETLTTRFRLRRSFSPSLQLTLDVPVHGYQGGWSDAIIESFHERFGFRNDERPWFNRDTYLVSVPGSSIDSNTPLTGSDIGDIALSAKWSPASQQGPGTRWALVGAVELPTGDRSTLRGSGSVDASMGLISSRTGERYAGHASFHLTALGSNHVLDTPSQLLASAGAAFGWKATPATAILVQAGIWQSPLRDLRFPELSPPVRQLTVAVRHAVTQRSAVHLAIGENIKDFENSSDLVVQVGLITTPSN